MITCYLKYTIDHYKIKEFEEYGKMWMLLVEKLGGKHHGYFLPHESANNIAVALFSFNSLTDYEKYRIKSITDLECKKAYDFAHKTKCIISYERTFLKPIINSSKKFMNAQIKYYENKLAYEMDPSDLYDTFENSTEYIAVDTRQPFGYEKEHIPTAINLPHRDMTEESTKHLDKSKTYVCYCDGIGCNASTKGALKMTQLGFKVKELIGGIAWWKLDGYATKGTQPSDGSLFECAC